MRSDRLLVGNSVHGLLFLQINDVAGSCCF